MNKSLALLTLLTLGSLPAFGKTLHFPNKGDIMFNITIPDDWEPEKDEDEVIEATSPQEKVSLSVWELEGKDDLKTLGSDIKDMLKDHAKSIKMEGDGVEAHPGGMDGVLFKGNAKDKEDDHAIDFFALVISNKSKLAVIYIEADHDTPKEEADKLEAILKSITPPGGAKKELLRAAIAVDKDSKPASVFSADVPKLYAFYVGEALTPGDKVRGAWIAEDVGDAAPKETMIDDASLVAKTPTDESAFSLTMPTKGWPLGKYRIDIYVNEKIATAVKFEIVKP